MVDSVYQVFVDLDARALEGGKVYVGEAYADPETTSVGLFWDDKLTIPADQPLQTSGGYIVRSGTPANVYTAANVYSVRVRDRSGGIVYYSASAGGKNGASAVTFPIPEGPPGKDAEAPQRADFIATPGQTRFPAVGKFGEVLGPGIQNPVFSYGSGVVATVNGQDIQPYSSITDAGDFIAPGLTDAITFTTPMEGGEEVTFLSFKLAGDGGNAKYPHKVFGIFVHLMREAGATDSTAAFEAAMALRETLNLPIYCVPGLGDQPDGSFVIQRGGQNLDLLLGRPAGRGNVYGNGVVIDSWGGKRATIRIISTDGGEHPYILFGNPVGNGTGSNPSIISGTDPEGIKDLVIQNINLFGNVEAAGNIPQGALIHLSALSNAVIQDCSLIGFSGDGIIIASGDIGSPTASTQVRHNIGVTIRRCLFDGINKNNRNGISVIDGAKVVIEDCTFLRCTRPGGVGYDRFNPNTGFKDPGAIDCEPNVATGVNIRMNEVSIRRNRFIDTGSNAVALFLPPNRLNGVDLPVPVRGFTVEENYALGCNGGLVSVFGAEDDPVGYDIKISKNRGYNLLTPFTLRGRRIEIDDNFFYNATTAADIGVVSQSGDYGGVRDLALRRNRFELCGNAIGAVRISRTDGDVRIEDNTFKDNLFAGIVFAGPEPALCVIAGLQLNRNRFIRTPNSPKFQAYTVARLTFEGTPKIDTMTCSADGNQVNGADTFDQVSSGQVMIAGLPVGAPPDTGRYIRGAIFPGMEPIPPGEPLYYRNSYDSNLSNTPVWASVPSPGALPDPAANQNVANRLTSLNGTMSTDGMGRYTATQSGDAIAQGTFASAVNEIAMLAPPSGSSGVYVFFAKNTVAAGAAVDTALWFNRGNLRLVINGALNADLGTGYELGVKVRARRTDGGVLQVWRTDPQTGVETQVFNGGVSAGATIPGVRIVTKNASIRLQSITS